jgi:hypothetical protein
MSLTIIPGYDFGTNEIPTRSNFQQAARVTITGLGFSHVRADITKVIGGQATGGTGATLPAQGYIWVDLAGNTWVKTNNGNVQLNRGGGGYESNRWEINPSTGGINEQRGRGAEVESGAGATESTLRWRTLFQAAGSSPLQGLAESSVASGPGRMIMRGMGQFVMNLTAQGGNQGRNIFLNFGPGAMMFTSVGIGGFWYFFGQKSGGLPPPAAHDWWSGLALGPNSGSSRYTNAVPSDVTDAYCMGWFWGPDNPRKDS